MSEEPAFLNVVGTAVMSLTTDAIFVVDVETLLIVGTNQAFTRAFGYTNEEAWKLTVYDLSASERAECDELLSRVRTAGELMLGIRQYRHKSGSVVEMESRVGTTRVGEHTYLCIVSRDLSEIQRAERVARESELRNRIFAEATFEAIAVSEHGRVVDGNQRFSELLGAPIHELVGRPVMDMIAPEFREQIGARFRAGEGEPLEHMMLRLDGTPIPVEAQAKSLRIDGRTLRVTALRDITLRKKLEQEKRIAQRLESVGRLAGGVAHDFNNLLTVILSVTKMMLEAQRSDAEKEDLALVETAAERAAELTSQLLAFARKQIAEPRVIDVNALLAGVVKLLDRVIGEHIRLVTAYDRELAAIRADPSQIEQVLMNLALNARDAMPAGGTLTIETRNVELGPDYATEHPDVQPGEYVLVAVTDTGAGMNAGTLERIFEPFFSTKPQSKGTGLGLATCYGIVKQSGGSIWVYSEPGRGTSFKVYLPRVHQSPEVAEVRPPAPSLGGGELLLLVEDDDMVRRLAQRILVKSGYSVRAAADGQEALAAFEELAGKVEVLITDVVLPRMSGKDLVVALRALNPALRVLYTSGYTENTIVHQGVVDEGVNFLAKPYSPQLLLNRVREVLDQPPGRPEA